ncbi:fimbrial protein [Erwinia sp. P6884]|uniref:fimbrial protein n=1 Tax=Erwinia sp. P6884 TaxID=3141450 RepID=UPI0031934E90
MRICIVSLIPLAVLSQVASASAAGQGHANVRVQGSIIDTPCAIAAENRDQSIDLSTLPLSTIVNEGVGPEKPFTIKLLNCSPETFAKGHKDWSKFSITFDGKSTTENLFSVSGEASGVGILLTDSSGNVAVPGKAMPQYAIMPDGMSLNYTLRLMANQQRMRAGDYQSTIRFKMDYY